MQQPHPLAVRIHDQVLQLLAFAVLKTEMCENHAELGHADEVIANLAELRLTLEKTVDELRSIMSDLRTLPATDVLLRNRAA